MREGGVCGGGGGLIRWGLEICVKYNKGSGWNIRGGSEKG